MCEWPVVPVCTDPIAGHLLTPRKGKLMASTFIHYLISPALICLVFVFKTSYHFWHTNRIITVCIEMFLSKPGLRHILWWSHRFLCLVILWPYSSVQALWSFHNDEINQVHIFQNLSPLLSDTWLCMVVNIFNVSLQNPCWNLMPIVMIVRDGTF